MRQTRRQPGPHGVCFHGHIFQPVSTITVKKTRSLSHPHKPQVKVSQRCRKLWICFWTFESSQWNLSWHLSLEAFSVSGWCFKQPQLGWWRTLRNCRIGRCLKLSGISWEDLTQGKTASKESGRSYLRLRQLPNFHPAQQLVPCRNCPTPCISDDKAIPTAIICPIFNTSQWHTH